MNWTDIFLFSSVGGILAVDAVIFYFCGEPGTFSYRLARYWNTRWPVIPFLAGFLCGHLFWPNRGYCQ